MRGPIELLAPVVRARKGTYLDVFTAAARAGVQGGPLRRGPGLDRCPAEARAQPRAHHRPGRLVRTGGGDPGRGVRPGAALGAGSGEGAPRRAPRTRGTPEDLPRTGEARGAARARRATRLTARGRRGPCSAGAAALVRAQLPPLRDRHPGAGPALVLLQHRAGALRGLRGDGARVGGRRRRGHRPVPHLRGNASPAHPPSGAALRPPLRGGGAAAGGARAPGGPRLVALGRRGAHRRRGARRAGAPPRVPRAGGPRLPLAGPGGGDAERRRDAAAAALGAGGRRAHRRALRAGRADHRPPPARHRAAAGESADAGRHRKHGAGRGARPGHAPGRGPPGGPGARWRAAGRPHRRRGPAVRGARLRGLAHGARTAPPGARAAADASGSSGLAPPRGRALPQSPRRGPVAAAGADDGGGGRVRLGQEHAGAAGAVSRGARGAGQDHASSGSVPPAHGDRAAAAGAGGGPVAHRPDATERARDLPGRLGRAAAGVRRDARGAGSRVRPDALLVQLGGRGPLSELRRSGEPSATRCPSCPTSPLRARRAAVRGSSRRRSRFAGAGSTWGRRCGSRWTRRWRCSPRCRESPGRCAASRSWVWVISSWGRGVTRSPAARPSG